MAEGSKGGGPGSRPGMGFVSKPAASVESAGGRTRFTVEICPGETTIVSWKKLLREADSSKPNKPGPSISGPETQRQPGASQSPHPPLPPASSDPFEEKEQNDSEVQAGSNRLSNVIERIERMHAGDGGSDEDDVMLDDVLDDDEYDTDDSFIDDAEFNDYFQVDNSRTKHHGFFVNRGKLDRVESTIPTSQQPKKRKDKDLTNSDDGHNSNKLVKTESKGRKASSLIQKIPSSQSHKVAMPNIQAEDMQFQAVPANAAEVSMKKKTADHTDDVIRKDKDIDGPRPKILSSKNHSSSKGKGSGPQDTSTHCSDGKSSHASISHSGKQLNNADNLEKGGRAASFNPNLPTPKVAFMPRKEGSSSRPTSTMLEKAIRELKKTVAESRPPSTDIQDPDHTSQAVKRRVVSPEIKQKLTEVARLAQESYEKIPMDLINHLMNIVGHLMQVRTLKKNLRDMANMGLSAKKEKDDRILRIKQEVTDMVKQRIPYMKSKIAEEDSSPPVRKLCQELVVLWPSGFMSTDGIKWAIHRAKDKRGQFSSRKNRENIKMKNVASQKTHDVINLTKALHIHEKSYSQFSQSRCSNGLNRPALENHSVLSPRMGLMKQAAKKAGIESRVGVESQGPKLMGWVYWAYSNQLL